MKTLHLIWGILIFGLFQSCSSSESNGDSQLTSNLTVNGITYIPQSIRVTNGIADMPNEIAKVFVLEKENSTSGNSDVIVFRINYPNIQTSSSGTYTFSIGTIGEVLFCQGSYEKTPNFYGLAGGNVIVVDQGNNKYKITFQNVEGIEINNSQPLMILGSIEGVFSI